MLATIGALSIAAATIACGASAQSVLFVAVPVSGPAPLTVTFCAAAGITLNFGDGASSGMQASRSEACPPGISSHVTHTYAAPGTYALRGLPCPSPHAAVCGAVAQQASQVKIVVTPRI